MQLLQPLNSRIALLAQEEMKTEVCEYVSLDVWQTVNVVLQPDYLVQVVNYSGDLYRLMEFAVFGENSPWDLWGINSLVALVPRMKSTITLH